MSTPISSTFATQLTQMRAQRGGVLSRADASAQARDTESDDWAKADTERDLAYALEERESAELVAIDAALQRVADGSYGLCVDCGTPIATARLHANPTAMRCVTCQARAEQPGGAPTHV
jgi:DnaK suppressor protein